MTSNGEASLVALLRQTAVSPLSADKQQAAESAANILETLRSDKLYYSPAVDGKPGLWSNIQAAVDYSVRERRRRP